MLIINRQSLFNLFNNQKYITIITIFLEYVIKMNLVTIIPVINENLYWNIHVI